MEKRAILAVVLMVAVIFVTNLLFPPVPPPEGLDAPESDSAAATRVSADSPFRADDVVADTPAFLSDEGADTSSLAAAEQETEPAQQAAPQLEASVPADTIEVRSDFYTLRFSTAGARLLDAELIKYQSFAPTDPAGTTVDLIRGGDALFGYSVAVGGDTVSIENVTFEASAARIDVGSGVGGDSLTFRYRFPGSEVTFVVTYRFSSGSYQFETEGRLYGIGDRGYSVQTSLGQGLRDNDEKSRGVARQQALVVNGRTGGIRAQELDKIDPGATFVAEGAPFNWVAVKNKYFLVALIAPETSPGFSGMIGVGMAEERSASMRTSIPVPGGSGGFRFDAYLGPQEYDRLEGVGQDLQNVNPYGWRWLRPVIRPLVKLVMVILTWMHQTLSLSYGWVLILFGVLMRVVLFPLYQKSMRSQMAQMQVQPLMKELQNKYKDDPQKLQQEMLKLYKEHNVNPLGGCLPMMVPMPILFTLFFVFQGTIEFRGVPFLWLPDLSLKDPLYIIPLLMGASMFLLQWIGQKGVEVNQQMKMMMYVMPVMFTVMFAGFPSGLHLYYTTSNLASIPQQLYLARERRKVREKTAKKN